MARPNTSQRGSRFTTCAYLCYLPKVKKRNTHGVYKRRTKRDTRQVLQGLRLSNIRKDKKYSGDLPFKKMVKPNNRLELLQRLQNEGLFAPLVAVGIVSISIATWLDIYSHYQKECEENQKTIAVQFTADYWKISERNLFRIIKFLETPIVTK